MNAWDALSVQQLLIHTGTRRPAKMPSIPMQTTISPNDQSPVCTRPLVSEEQLDVVISDAVKAQKSWKKVSIDERIQIAEKWMVNKFVDVLSMYMS
jgi:acyl-CoA reductase-like NAD-dependent aldehyde dehydrogenase